MTTLFYENTYVNYNNNMAISNYIVYTYNYLPEKSSLSLSIIDSSYIKTCYMILLIYSSVSEENLFFDICNRNYNTIYRLEEFIQLANIYE